MPNIGGQPFVLNQISRQDAMPSVSTKANFDKVQKSDKVAHLTDASKLPQELEDMSKASVLVLKKNGQEYILSLAKLNPTQRLEFVNKLKSDMLDPQGKVKPGFNLDNYIKVTQNPTDASSPTIQFGETQYKETPVAGEPEVIPGKVTFDASLETKEGVVTKANQQTEGFRTKPMGDVATMPADEMSARFWDFMNGAESADGENARFRNGVSIENGAPVIKLSPMAKGSMGAEDIAFMTQFNALPADQRIKQYVAMMGHEFNINQSLQTLTQDQFVEAMCSQESKNGNPQAGSPQFKDICGMVYNMSKGVVPPQLMQGGKLDPQFIAKFQGMLNVIAPQIQSASDTNTDMQGEQAYLEQEDFAALPTKKQAQATPGPDGKLPDNQSNYFDFNGLKISLGDGADGRATSMQRRFFGGSLTVGPPETRPTGTVVREEIKPMQIIVQNFDKEFRPGELYITDQSGSMKNAKAPIAFRAIKELTGDTVSGKKDNFAETGLIEVDGRQITDQELLDKSLEFFGNDADALVEAFGVPGVKASDIMTRGQIDPVKFKKQIGLGTGETGVKAMLAKMLFDDQFSPEGIVDHIREYNTPPRLNGIADEPDKSIQYLKVLQKVAEMKMAKANEYITKLNAANPGKPPVALLTEPIQCRIIAIPTSLPKEDSDKQESALKQKTKFIDLNKPGQYYEVSNPRAKAHPWIEEQYQVNEID